MSSKFSGPPVVITPISRRDSPAYVSYEPPVDEPYNPDEPKEDDSEAQSVFVPSLLLA